jgi:hypothetical protein
VIIEQIRLGLGMWVWGFRFGFDFISYLPKSDDTAESLIQRYLKQ